jgi:DNA-binding Lrp family transcriptional regulator
LSILGALERDACQSFASLSQAVGLSKTPCWARVQELEKSGAIRGYYADINPRAVGLGVFAFIAVKIDFIQRQAFEVAASGQLGTTTNERHQSAVGVFVGSSFTNRRESYLYSTTYHARMAPRVLI